jgi:hypothetical protein
LPGNSQRFQFYWILGHCGVEVNKRAFLEASNQSKKAERVNYYYQWQILKPCENKAKRSFPVSVKTLKRTEEKATLKGTTTGIARLRGSAR